MLALMGASDEVLRTGSTFSRVMLGGSGTVVMLFLINAVFRGAGDAAIAMRVLWFANAINIILGPCLIFGLGPFPELGVVGAALGTTIGRGSGVLYQLYHLARRGGRLEVHARHWRFDLDVMRTILRISGNATFQNFVNTASWMGLVRILTTFGSAAVAGNTIGIRIIIFALLPSFGVSNAAATLVGQNLGAGKPERAEAAAWKAALYNTMFLGGIGLIFLLFAPLLISFFTQRSRGGALRCQLPAHHLDRIPVLRLRDGADLGIQRRRGHTHADADRAGLSVGIRDSAGVGARRAPRFRADRRVHRRHRRVLDDVPGERVAVQEGKLEAETSVRTI